MTKAYDGKKWYVMTTESMKRNEETHGLVFAGYRGSVARKSDDNRYWDTVWTDTVLYPTRGKCRIAALRKRAELEAVQPHPETV